MKKLLITLIVCILLTATFGWAAWHGWIKHTGGEYAADYTEVTARAYFYPSHPNVTVSLIDGGYFMGPLEGMVIGRYYKYVDAEDTGHYGFVSGVTYFSSPRVEKDITLNDAYPNED